MSFNVLCDLLMKVICIYVKKCRLPNTICSKMMLHCRDGDWSAEFTTEKMAWAAIKEDTLHSGVYPAEQNIQPL